MHTLGYDVLTDPPDWVVAHVRRLHDNGRRAPPGSGIWLPGSLRQRVHLDRHGHLPDGWTDIGVRPATAEYRRGDRGPGL